MRRELKNQAVRSTGNTTTVQLVAGSPVANTTRPPSADAVSANVTVAPAVLPRNSSGASSISRPSIAIDFSHHAPIGLRMPAE